MSISLKKSLGIRGCAIFKLDNDGKAGQTPNVDNVAITLPSIELETTSIQLMGSLEIPDVSRLGNLQLTANIPLDLPEAMALCELGKTVSWKITWCSVIYNHETGESTPKSFSVDVTGFVASIPNAEVNAGAENTGDVTLNLIKYKKTNLSDNKVIFEIDRGNGIFKVDGNDLFAQINSLY